MNEVWHIGDIKITRVVEMEVTGGSRFILPTATRDACLEILWLAPHFMDEKGNLRMSIHALVIDTGDRRIVVDTCIGNDKQRSIPNWTNLQTEFLTDLAKAGYPRETIDTVLCTHLHVDHVGWNTMLVDGEWVPTFENARYLIGEDEWRYWDGEEEDEYGPILTDSVRPVVAAGLVDFVANDHVVAPGIQLESTPGHTPATSVSGSSQRARSRSSRATASTTPVRSPAPTGAVRPTSISRWVGTRARGSWRGLSTRTY